MGSWRATPAMHPLRVERDPRGRAPVERVLEGVEVLIPWWSPRELERWLAIDIGQRYHQSEHRGLPGATPLGAWKVQSLSRPVRHLAAFHAAFPARYLTYGSTRVDPVQPPALLDPRLSTLVGADRPVTGHFDPAHLSKLYILMHGL